MKFTLLFLLLSFLIYGCKNKELPAKYLSTITVVRETGGNHNIRQTGEEATSPSHATPILPQQANTHSGTRYHIIVASFSSAEKKRAEQLAKQLEVTGDESTVRFSVLFDELQYTAGLLDELVRGMPPAKADKFRAALRKALQALADQMEGGA